MPATTTTPIEKRLAADQVPQVKLFLLFYWIMTGTHGLHVTIGIASQDFLKKLLDEKFESFTFSPVGASVYHLGNFGTARKKLKGWELKP